MTTPTKTFLKWATSGLFFVIFVFSYKNFTKKTEGYCGIRTRIIGCKVSTLTTWPPTSKTLGLNVSKLCIGTGCLDSRVVIALNFFWTLVRYALGREFAPRWWQTLYWLEYKICTQKEDAVEERRYNNDIMFISNG